FVNVCHVGRNPAPCRVHPTVRTSRGLLPFQIGAEARTWNLSRLGQPLGVTNGIDWPDARDRHAPPILHGVALPPVVLEGLPPQRLVDVRGRTHRQSPSTLNFFELKPALAGPDHGSPSFAL